MSAQSSSGRGRQQRVLSTGLKDDILFAGRQKECGARIRRPTRTTSPRDRGSVRWALRAVLSIDEPRHPSASTNENVFPPTTVVEAVGCFRVFFPHRRFHSARTVELVMISVVRQWPRRDAGIATIHPTRTPVNILLPGRNSKTLVLKFPTTSSVSPLGPRVRYQHPGRGA